MIFQYIYIAINYKYFCLTYAVLLDENPPITSNSILFCELLILLIGKIMYSYVYKKENKSLKKITVV